MLRAYGILISLRAKNKLKAYSSFEKWNTEEERTLKQVGNTRKVSLYFSMRYKYPEIPFLLCYRKEFFFNNFQENTTEYKRTDILVPRLLQSKV